MTLRTIIGWIIAFVIVDAIGAAIVILVVMPRMNWDATGKPSAPERWVAHYVVDHWVSSGATNVTNPVAQTPENLHQGENEYDEHCAVCHGFDGSARNTLNADFYPPVPRLARGVQAMRDGEVYFIVANGVRMTAMPGYGKTHSPDELWHVILWVRHFPNLTPDEKAAIERKMNQTEHKNAKRQEERSNKTEAPAPQ